MKFKKNGTLVGPTFFGTFFCQKYGIGKNSAAAEKIAFFVNRRKTSFTVLKIYLYIQNISFKVHKKCKSFNKVKPIFVDLYKILIFFELRHYFSHISEKKKCTNKIWSHKCALFFNLVTILPNYAYDF